MKWLLPLQSWQNALIKEMKCLNKDINRVIEQIVIPMEFSLNSVNSENLINHWSMNHGQFRDVVCHMCLAGTVVASWLLTQEVAGSSPLLWWQLFVSLNSANSGKTFRENSNAARHSQVIAWITATSHWIYYVYVLRSMLQSWSINLIRFIIVTKRVHSSTLLRLSQRKENKSSRQVHNILLTDIEGAFVKANRVHVHF